MNIIRKFSGFVGFPYSSPEGRYFRALVVQASADLVDDGVSFHAADEGPLLGYSLKGNVIEKIKRADFMLALWEGLSPNVFWEVGLAEGLGKPILGAVAPPAGGWPEGLLLAGEPSLVRLSMDPGKDRGQLVLATRILLKGLAERAARSDACIFLCHRSTDKGSVAPVAQYLQGIGYYPWFDTWEIRPGDSVPDSISRGLAGATHFVIFLSRNTSGSAWVSKEINTALMLALDRGKPRLIPVFLDAEGKENTPTLLQEIRGVQFYERPIADALSELHEGLRIRVV